MMRSPALDSLDSREMPYVLRKDKRLRYNNADGSNNLVEWIPDVIQMAKAAQPAFHKCWNITSSTVIQLHNALSYALIICVSRRIAA